MPSIKRTILITGGTSGIGYNAVLKMLELNNNLIVPCKNIISKKKLLTKLNYDLCNLGEKIN